MALLGNVASIFGGNSAAKEIEKQRRANIRDYSREQGRQEDVNDPFLTGGTRAFNALADYSMTPPGTLDPVSQAIEDQVARGITGRFSAMGLNDSGAHTNALAQALIPLRMGLRQNRFAELLPVAGFGERGANRFNQIGQFATTGRVGERAAIGDVRAGAKMNMWNQFGAMGDTVTNALSGAFVPNADGKNVFSMRKFAEGTFG